MSKIIYAADLFCGAGGTSTGLAIAAEKMGINLKLTAINHWETAIETHSKNHPWANHFQTSLGNLKPSTVVPSGRLDLLLASPECTHHSNARGGKPRDDQSRSSAWHVAHWCQELYIKTVIVENIKEFAEWGPLGANKKPLKRKKGHVFQAFINAMKALGYNVSWKIINCADFGDATTRQRFFMIANRGRRPKFPGITHWKNPEPDMFGQTFKPWKTAQEIIDWAIPGHSIFLSREDVSVAGLKIRRPLAEKTLNRIAIGIERYWSNDAEPFLILLRGTAKTKKIDVPVPTITAGGSHIGLATPLLIRYNDGGRLQLIDQPISTIDTSNRFGLLRPLIMDTPNLKQTQPFIIKYNRTGIAYSIDAPIDTVTTDDRFGLVRPVLIKVNGRKYYYDILFRMLTPKELAAAHSFPETYQFCGNRSDIIKQIGNSVPVKTASELCESILAA